MIGRRGAAGRRGSLLGTAARTAVVAGTATAVGSRVAHRHRQNAAEQAAPGPGAPSAPAVQPETAPITTPSPGQPAGSDVLEQLERLAALRTQGMLTDEEFVAAKQRLLEI
ncbi:SHOCT domain-containing protein [Actinospica sp.]|jgi:hypothetical protein|uniref:SHOCT domain-containing protein n=1 Tax=Actinospica sp. TaxID=1872142 RepID=UPI002C34FC28|nr:SHOCT domain-containing protein [Actinospica sp.]HWG27030.1 SHOCT domain-containing protein [Actinospica sp.]